MTTDAPLATTSYFDGRPDARFFAAVVGNFDVVVSIRENLRTYGVTDGEVWAAWRNDDRLFEHRFVNIDDARHHLAKVVRGESWPVLWVPIERAAYVVVCPICEAAFGQPCIEDGEPLLASRGRVMVVGAPVQPDIGSAFLGGEPHDVEVNLVPLVHAGRMTRHHQSLHGERARGV